VGNAAGAQALAGGNRITTMNSEITALAPRRQHIPGETGIWVFILGDMLVFALFFAVYTFHFARDPAAFIGAQSNLNINYGLANTFLLLTSSWFVALAVDGVKKGLAKTPPVFFGLALACGFGFGVLKIIEYRAKIEAGFGLTSNDFFMYYFVLTGIHFAHVLIGMVLLVLLFRVAARGASRPNDIALIEIGASYWHMVDLLWIVLFCLLYLLK
jgi:nitric oxide reductase NorE protein